MLVFRVLTHQKSWTWFKSFRISVAPLASHFPRDFQHYDQRKWQIFEHIQIHHSNGYREPTSRTFPMVFSVFLVMFHQPPQVLGLLCWKDILFGAQRPFPFCFQVTFCQSRHEMGAEGDVKVNSFPGATKNKRRWQSRLMAPRWWRLA